MDTTVVADQLITTGEAAKLLGLSGQMARKYAEAGRVRALHTPLGWLLDGDDVAALAAERARRKETKAAITAINSSKQTVE